MTDYKSTQVNRITGIQFGILSPKEIRERSVAEITTQETYIANEPVVGGLFDPRMGVSEYGKICPTDGLDSRECPGYFGHIELARPVYHYHYLNIIQKILRCVCVRCGQILIDKNNPKISEILKKKKQNRWMDMISISQKIKVCGAEREDGCGAKQPDKIQREGVGKLWAEWKSTNGEEARKQLLSAEHVLKILKRISNEECEILGFSRFWCRPDWMICQVLPVPPPTVRPSVKQDNNQRMEDDLTHKLVDIIKTNKMLQSKIEAGSSPQVIDEWTTLLQYHIATLIDNEIPGVAPAQQRSGRPLKSIRQRLKSKEGRIRGNLMGKRVDFSARSVITPDPNISIDELGVPRHIAKNLTFPETVTPFNKSLLTQYARNGPDVYPGAKTIFKKSTQKLISLKHIPSRKDLTLDNGDIIHRHLIDGDVVLFNRQPSLHKMSMMGHRVRVMDYSTFRLNVSVTSPYNADFDGDEMNMHVPQSLQTKTELKLLTAVPYQIISPRENKPIISIVQDTLLGTNRITRDKVSIKLQQMMNLMMWNQHFDGNLPKSMGKKGWSGRQAFSMIIPENVNLSMGNKSYDDDKEDHTSHNFVKIKDGNIIQGQLDKDLFTKTSRGLVHTIFNDYGPAVARKFLDNIQFIITQYLLDTGFSVGISDLIADQSTLHEIKDNILQQEREAEEVIKHVHLGIFENLSGKSLQEDFETKMNGLMGRAVNKAGNIGLKSLSSENRMINMVKAGSKGNSINVGQMIACVGQQAVDGKRVPYGFNNRTLPHFTKFDDGPASRGFVENSFMSGLKPHEFFFHAMGGREGLIDTAVKTSETGYIQRKLMKAMEDLKVGFDLTVRNSNNSIVQFIYGEDGIDSCKIESQMLPIGECSYEDFVQKYRFPAGEKWEFMDQDTIDNMKKIANWSDKLENYFQILLQDQKKFIEYSDFNPNNAVYSPVHVGRLINTYNSKFNINRGQPSNLHPIQAINMIENLLDTIRHKKKTKNLLFEIMIRHHLNPVIIIKKHSFTREAFQALCQHIVTKYIDSFVQPGEMVGAIAAQSIGEPATQMTLNTFHFAGVGEKSNVTRGVPRLKELLHISHNPKNPSVTVALNEDIKYRQDLAQEIKNGLEITRLRELVSHTKIYFDPSDLSTVIEKDRPLLELYKEFQEIDPVCQDEHSPSNWVLRFEINRKELLERQITMEDIVFSIKEIYQNDLSCIYSDDNSDELILRIRINKESDSEEDEGIFLLRMIEKSMLEKIIIQGVNGIEKVTMRTSKDVGHFNDEGDFERTPEWVLDTDGVNLVDIMNFPGVDPTKTISNDIYEMNECLGIEAARYTLFKEMYDVISFEGAYVNYRHLALLVETMTFRGGLMSIDRHGINRGDIGPLAKCSFEETTDQLLKAAIFGESDPVVGVSANIMLGQIAPGGTGSCDLLLDEEEFFNLLKEKETSDLSGPTEDDDLGFEEDDEIEGCFMDELELPGLSSEITSEDITYDLPDLKVIVN